MTFVSSESSRDVDKDHVIESHSVLFDRHHRTEFERAAGTKSSKKAEAIKRKVDSLAPPAPISVIPIQGHEQFGEFLSKDQEGFSFHDVDRKIDVTCKYFEVRKVKNGYGGYNSVQGRHTDGTKAIVISAIVIGALGALIGAEAAKN